MSGEFLQHLPASNSDQQGNPVFIVEDSSEGGIGVRTGIVDEYANMRWQSSSFVQQIRLGTRVGGGQSFQNLPKCDAGSIERYVDTWLTDNDSGCTKERDTYMHGFALLKKHSMLAKPFNAGPAYCVIIALQTVLLADVGADADGIEFVHGYEHV